MNKFHTYIYIPLNSVIIGIALPVIKNLVTNSIQYVKKYFKFFFKYHHRDLII